MRVLLVTWDAGGNIPPFLGLGAELRRRGHDVSCLGSPSLREPMQRAGISLIPLERGQAFDPLARLPLSESLAVQKELFFGHGMQEDFLRVCKDMGPDLVVIDFCQVSAIASAIQLGLPTVILTHTLLGRILPHWDRTFLQQINDCLEKTALPAVRSTAEFWEKSRAVLAATASMLDEDHWPGTNPRIVYTGPIFEPGELPPPAGDAEPVLPPKILISFSTTFMEQLEPMRQAMLAASGLEVHATVTTGPAIRPSELPGAPNLEVVEWVSHARILPQVSVAIVHAGHSSVAKALSFGVPLLCMPLGRDQHYVAERVAQLGAGLVVQGNASSGEIRESLARLLADRSYRINAGRIAAAMRLAGRGEQNGADLLERLFVERPIAAEA